MATIKKPSLDLAAEALKFAGENQTSQEAPRGSKTDEDRFTHSQPLKVALNASKQVSGLVPDGDVRLTANIRQDLHLKLKIRAAEQRTTIGEIIEELVQKHL